ncbi:integrin alpha-5-like isoform X1 [Penaeus japonicus]|uniref:integrin alpha-5-like isoform X1 n=2 Tax=Penaeus japonicus TaxID=27405 RepID=UPI001C70E0CB|nr:integrin alpha-5-like isoform X1 [Penaeus japonicus]
MWIGVTMNRVKGCTWGVVMTKVIVMMVMTVMMVNQTHGFNLNTTLARVLTGPAGSDFGFSVALWSDVNGGKSLVAGAPKGKYSTISKGELPMGNIFICDTQGTECKPDVRLPSVSDRDKSKGALEIEHPHPMAFGQTLSTLKTNNSTLAACAPHYPRLENVTQVRGACFLLSHRDAEPQKIVPYDKHAAVAKTFQNVMAGYSAELFSKDGLYLVTGGPIGFYGSGVVNARNINKRDIGRASRLSHRNANDDYLSDSHEGWQVTADKFDGENMIIAASIVNYGKYTGMVKFYPISLGSPLRTLEGEETGAKFGYSLASGDFDGDGVSDLAVGAPLARGDFGNLDAGCVFVYYSPVKENGLQKQTKIEGHSAWGRFGIALTSLGDINGDGYDDLAVGAPYEDGTGAVYIFNGDANVGNMRSSQVLRASDFPVKLSGFGFSLDGGLDLDENGYPDMVIGALGSESMVYVRSAPVVTLVGGVRFESESIYIEEKECFTDAAGYKTMKGVCFALKVDVAYTSKQPLGKLNMLFEMELEGQSSDRHHVFRANNDYRYERVMPVSYVGRKSEWTVTVFTRVS